MFTTGIILGMTPIEYYKNILMKVVSKNPEEPEFQEELIKSGFFASLAKGCKVDHCTENGNYGLKFSPIPDFVIAKDSRRILVEVKRLTWVDPSRQGFSGKGAKQLLRMSKDGKISANELSEIFKWCSEFSKINFKKDEPVNPIPGTMPNVANIVPDWYEQGNDDPGTYPSYDAGTKFTFTFKDGTKVKLYQLDWYLLDLYCRNCQYVIWTNGLVWKIFFIKDGTLQPPKEFHLDENGHDYIPRLSGDVSEYKKFVEQRIQIDQNEFNALINCLKYIFSIL